MPHRIPADKLHRIRDPKNFIRQMIEDVELLHSHRASMSLSTVIVCCIDALAAGNGKASRGKFEAFIERHFKALCDELRAASRARSGPAILYNNYRNGFAHLRGPKSRFAIADDHELNGAWAGELEVEGVGTFVAINLERFAGAFLQFLRSHENSAV